MDTRHTRRTFLRRLGAGSATMGVLLAGCSAATSTAQPTSTSAATAAAATASPPQRTFATATKAEVVRLDSVVIPQDSGLYASLLPDFEKRTGYRVEVTTAQDVFGPARAGKADLVLVHYQHPGVAAFVQEGLGEWPRLVFSSPAAIIGPRADPADVRSAKDAVDALRRISRSGVPFIVNDIDGLRYVMSVMLGSANVEAGPWYVDKGIRGPDAMRAAVQSGGYTLWGLVPFVRQQQQDGTSSLEALFVNDQILKSVMATILVNAKQVDGVNATGAKSLQDHLLSAETQSKIRTFRMAGSPDPVWWPAAQDNDKAILPR